MPVSNKVTAKRETMTSQSGCKASGTRLGIMLDWRGAATKCGKTSGRHGHRIRDGR
jgi:hypothetical protein